MRLKSVCVGVLAAVLSAGPATVSSAAPLTEVNAAKPAQPGAGLDDYSDEELLKLLLAGVGPAADQNPEVVKRLGFNPDRQRPDPRALDQAIDEYLRYDKRFDAVVRDGITSRNPQLVEAALVHLSEQFSSMIYQKYGARVEKPGADGAPDGFVGFKAKVALTAAAVANVVVYANVAGATNAVVALVIVPTYVSYLMDPNSNSKIERHELIRAVAEAS